MRPEIPGEPGGRHHEGPRGRRGDWPWSISARVPADDASSSINDSSSERRSTVDQGRDRCQRPGTAFRDAGGPRRHSSSSSRCRRQRAAPSATPTSIRQPGSTRRSPEATAAQGFRQERVFDVSKTGRGAAFSSIGLLKDQRPATCGASRRQRHRLVATIQADIVFVDDTTCIVLRLKIDRTTAGIEKPEVEVVVLSSLLSDARRPINCTWSSPPGWSARPIRTSSANSGGLV